MLIVQKYGGATLANPEKIKSVAHRIKTLTDQGHQVVAIVSAMGQTTNQLIELAQKVSGSPNLREMDMLLSTGERVSMALVSMALHDLNCPAISFTGSQAGILTNDSHINALITDVKAFRVSEALQAKKVVVLAGYQGVSPTTKEITTLGRGGTDTTAVAMSVHLKADHCEILKEVPAVFSADPNLVKSAKPLTEISYEQLAHMCFWGAKVLHYRSVELAARNKIPLFVGPAHDKAHDRVHDKVEGTWIRHSQSGGSMFESVKIISLNSFEKVLCLQGSFKDSGVAYQNLVQFFEKSQTGIPQFLATESKGPQTIFKLTGPSEILTSITQALGSNKEWVLTETLSAVTATCTGSVAPELMGQVIGRLNDSQIPFQSIQNTAMGLTIFVNESDRKKAIEKLHSLI